MTNGVLKSQFVPNGLTYIKFLVKYLEDAELDHLAQLHPELMSRLARNDLDIFDIMEDLDLVGDFYFLNKLVLNDGTEIRGAQITFLVGPRITILYTLSKKVTLYSENIKERLFSFQVLNFNFSPNFCWWLLEQPNKCCNGDNQDGAVKIDIELTSGERIYMDICLDDIDSTNQQDTLALLSEALGSNFGLELFRKSQSPHKKVWGTIFRWRSFL